MTVQRLGLRRLAVMGYAVTFSCLTVISGAYPLLAIPTFGPSFPALRWVRSPTPRTSGASAAATPRPLRGWAGSSAPTRSRSCCRPRATIGYIALAPLVGLLFVLL